MAAIRLDLARIWADAVAMARANIDALSAIAGMFMLLPGVLSSWILPEPARPDPKARLGDILTANSDYMAAHWPIIVLSGLLVAFGSLAILALLVHPTRPTVADALRLGLVALPFYMLASMLQAAAVIAGCFLFLLPGIYLAARFLCIASVAVAEGRHGPIAIMARSFQLTRGNGLRLLLLLAVMLIVGVIVSTVARSVVGIAGALLLPADLARFANILMGSLIETAFALAVTIVGAAVYRRTAT